MICHENNNLAVHHIIERKLFNDGGYYMENGVTLCESHHLDAEMTKLSCEQLRTLAGIKTVMLPEHFTEDTSYDKWGNPVLPNGMRLRGELFYEEPVQKMLAQGNVLSLFVERDSPKYPRTFHFDFSPGKSADDKILETNRHLLNTEIVITEKLDGSNVDLEYNACYARTHSSLPKHPSFDAFKAIHSNLKYSIPKEYQIFGEWCFAVHSIEYELDDYLHIFGIRDLSKMVWLSWDEVEMWSEELNVPTVPVLFKGKFNNEIELKATVENLSMMNSCYGSQREGVVIRVINEFTDDDDFTFKVGKWVRKNHIVSNSEHWKRKIVIKQKLIK